MKNKIKIVVAICLLAMFALMFIISNMVMISAEEDLKSISLDSEQEVTGGNTHIAHVFISGLNGIASLKFNIHYDSDLIRIDGVSNTVDCLLCDYSNQNDTISCAYVFGDNDYNIKTHMLYFSYTVIGCEEATSSFFDVVVEEAYDAKLNNIDVAGTRFYFKVNEAPQEKKYCYIYGADMVNTSMNEEFELSYELSTPEIASGTIEIKYNSELFEFVSLEQSDFFKNKLVDVNSNIAGSVMLSFVGTQYEYVHSFLTVRFKTISNVNETDSIQLIGSNFCDLELNDIICNTSFTIVSLTYSESFDETIPRMYLTPSFNSTNNQVTVTIGLSQESMLGAGDFTLKWNKDYYEYVSFDKKFNPSFFNVNDKEVSKGQLKFSIISLSDIIESCQIIDIVFNVKNPHDDTITLFEIRGDGLTDSLTNEISLAFQNCSQNIPGKCVFGKWSISKEATLTESGQESRSCNICGKIETRNIGKLDPTIAFMKSVASIDIANDSIEVIYSKLVLCAESYEYIDNKENVLQYYTDYMHKLERYQELVSTINREYSTAKEVESKFFVNSSF